MFWMNSFEPIFIQAESNTHKGTAHSQIKYTPFPPTCSAIYAARLFWFEFPDLGKIRDICLLNLVKLDGTGLVELKLAKDDSTVMSLSRNYDLVTKDDLQSLM